MLEAGKLQQSLGTYQKTACFGIGNEVHMERTIFGHEVGICKLKLAVGPVDVFLGRFFFLQRSKELNHPLISSLIYHRLFLVEEVCISLRHRDTISVLVCGKTIHSHLIRIIHIQLIVEMEVAVVRAGEYIKVQIIVHKRTRVINHTTDRLAVPRATHHAFILGSRIGFERRPGRVKQLNFNLARTIRSSLVGGKSELECVVHIILDCADY